MERKTEKKAEEFTGFVGNGILFQEYQTQKGVTIKRHTLILFFKQILSFTLADKEGWTNKEGKVYKFHFHKHRLYIKKAVIGFDFLR